MKDERHMSYKRTEVYRRRNPPHYTSYTDLVAGHPAHKMPIRDKIITAISESIKQSGKDEALKETIIVKQGTLDDVSLNIAYNPRLGYLLIANSSISNLDKLLKAERNNNAHYKGSPDTSAVSRYGYSLAYGETAPLVPGLPEPPPNTQPNAQPEIPEAIVTFATPEIMLQPAAPDLSFFFNSEQQRERLRINSTISPYHVAFQLLTETLALEAQKIIDTRGYFMDQVRGDHGSITLLTNTGPIKILPYKEDDKSLVAFSPEVQTQASLIAALEKIRTAKHTPNSTDEPFRVIRAAGRCETFQPPGSYILKLSAEQRPTPPLKTARDNLRDYLQVYRHHHRINTSILNSTQYLQDTAPTKLRPYLETIGTAIDGLKITDEIKENGRGLLEDFARAHERYHSQLKTGQAPVGAGDGFTGVYRLKVGVHTSMGKRT